MKTFVEQANALNRRAPHHHERATEVYLGFHVGVEVGQIIATKPLAAQNS